MQPDTAQPPPAAIELRVHDGVATLLLNRPQVRNAIDDMRTEFIERWSAGRDDGDPRAGAHRRRQGLLRRRRHRAEWSGG